MWSWLRKWDSISLILRLFIQILYETFEKEAETSGNERLLLTAAVAAAKVNIDKAYEVDKLASLVPLDCFIRIIFITSFFFLEYLIGM